MFSIWLSPDFCRLAKRYSLFRYMSEIKLLIKPTVKTIFGTEGKKITRPMTPNTMVKYFLCKYYQKR